MAPLEPPSLSADTHPAPETPAHQTDVYAIHGADPEVLAYAMAKYSRSALSMRESLQEISSQRAEQFLNTFYFQYGHRSIADLAHIPMAIERLSLLAAIDLVDEQRWDGQERSTRYQNFRTSGWYTPASLGEQTAPYTAAVEALFHAYDQLGGAMLAVLKDRVARPDSMKPDAYDRTLKARAFDSARYLLPLATNTSLGQITNARTLETQVARLLSSPFAEIRTLGLRLRQAASEPAWNVADSRDVRVAPTLVKYAEPNSYAIAARQELSAAASGLLGHLVADPAPVVDLLDDEESLEVELATSLLYPHSHLPYRQIRAHVADLPEARRTELIALGTRHRGRHDELLRAFSAGHGFRFDLLMDIGGFRDMHRHRRCIQLLQPFTDAHGWDEPTCPGQPSLAEAGLDPLYTSAMEQATGSYRALRSSGIPEAAQTAQYLLPLGTRCRSMFKMDFAEALYIAELRSGIAGHYSYRRVAWEMFQAIAKRHPALAPLFRISDVTQPVDLLQR